MSPHKLFIVACLAFDGAIGLAAAAPNQPAAVVPAVQEVELLHAAPSLVVVSSTVNNKTIRPEHLVDGKLDTAWNSRSGELLDEAIEFVVPAAARVSAIRMAAGFLAQGQSGDLYTLNHRVTRVRVRRDGVSVGEFPLDPERRELQRIPIDRPGGSFRIEVVATQPGQKTQWREICISELEVWGTLPAGLPPRRQDPAVHVGRLMRPEDEAVSDLVAYCKNRDTEIAQTLANETSAVHGAPGPFCVIPTEVDGAKSLPAGSAADGSSSPFLAAKLYDNTRGAENPIGARTWTSWTDLALRTNQGWHLYPLLQRDTLDNPHCTGYSRWMFQQMSSNAQGLTLRYLFESVQNPISGATAQERSPGHRTQTTYILTCLPWPGSPPICIESALSKKELPYKS